jgi:hypothetical protein
MVLLGLLLLLTGLIMNFRVLRRPIPARGRSDGGAEGPKPERMTPAEIMRTPPWLVSAGLIVAGFAILIAFH